MARYQLCEFWRTGRKVKGSGTKAENPWERGIAKVKDFGLSDVEFILDEKECKLPYSEVRNYRLLKGHGYTAIDTETDATV